MEFFGNLHPVIVHFPIALFTVYSLFELSTLYFKDKNFERIILLILGTGLLSAVWALMTGNKALGLSSPHMAPEQIAIAEYHETFATISTFYYAGLFFIKFFLLTKKKFDGIVKYIYLTMVFIGIIFIYLTGYYGGQLVFKYGIGTRLFN